MAKEAHRILKNVQAFTGDSPRLDDITLIVLTKSA
jgi:serine phosphatase RsbU (regulator of sigma subunit)